MISVDTNVLFAWLNRDHESHPKALSWILSQQENANLVLCELVLVELYGLLRNPVLLDRPMNAPEAVELIQRLRNHPTWELIDYPGGLMNSVWTLAGKNGVARRRIYDTRLAMALRHHGIRELATTNVKDFRDFGFNRVWNPLA